MSSDPNSTKMDNREDLEHNVPCTFDNVMFGQTPNPPPPPLLPTGTPVLPWPAAETGWFVNNTFPGSCLPASQQQGPLTVAPTIMRPASMYREPGTDNQGQLRQPEVVAGVIRVSLIKVLKTFACFRPNEGKTVLFECKISLLSPFLYFTLI